MVIVCFFGMASAQSPFPGNSKQIRNETHLGAYNYANYRKQRLHIRSSINLFNGATVRPRSNINGYNGSPDITANILRSHNLNFSFDTNKVSL